MNKRPRPHWGMLLNPVHFLSLGMGSGLAQKMPGTVGTLAALLIYLLFLQYLPLPAYLAFIVLSLVLGIGLCAYTSRRLGGDHPAIVWDEFVGCWIAVAALPATTEWLFMAFVLFRLLDILKPWPIVYFDRLPGGIGIMMDDVTAGLMSCAILHFALYTWG